MITLGDIIESNEFDPIEKTVLRYHYNLNQLDIVRGWIKLIRKSRKEVNKC